MVEGSKLTKSLKRPIQWMVTLAIIIFLFEVVHEASKSNSGSHPNFTLQYIRQIGQAMYSYAQDHKGAYPTGHSSTEVFQKLIDGEYITDPALFLNERLTMPGKTKATSKKLRPENVSYDVTVPVDANSSDLLPLVFSTGYRIDYLPGGSATPLFPWAKAWTGIAVFYKGNSAVFLKNDGQPDGMVTNFISTAFDPAGKKYQQLTPDGPLP